MKCANCAVLANFAVRYPHELSGGEQQRAALARALAAKPTAMLMDEPFSRLGESLRKRLAKQVRDILKSRQLTTLFVTNNQHEAVLLADVGGVINQGVICQWDNIYDLYRRPQCAFVADFVGDGALLRVRLTTNGAVDMEMGILQGDSRICVAIEKWRTRIIGMSVAFQLSSGRQCKCRGDGKRFGLISCGIKASLIA